MSIEMKMAWRNVWRNPRRTILTITAIAFAALLLVFMLSWQFGAYSTMIDASVKINTGHLQIQAQGYQQKMDMRKVVASPEKMAKLLEKMEAVDAFTYRARAFSLISSKERTYGALVVGVDPENEARVSTLKSLVRKGSYLSREDTDQALVGELLAKNLQVTPGDELTVLGQGKDGSVAAAIFIVKGIFSSGIDDFDRNVMHVPLKYFQEIYSMSDGVHQIVINGKSLDDVSKLQKRLEAEAAKIQSKNPLTALNWNELTPGLLQVIAMDLIMGVIFYIILVIVVAFSIMNTFLMAVFERTKEFGVLMAMGVTPSRLSKLLLMESFILTLIGVVIGLILGSVITLYYQHTGFDLTGASEMMAQYGISGRMYPRLSPLSALAGPLAVLFITFLTALYPALKVRKLLPVEAMK